MGDRNGFLDQFATEKERWNVSAGRRPGIFYTTIFAVKESIFKALGCGLHSGSYWHDVELDGQMKPHLSGYMKQLAANKFISRIHVAAAKSKKYSVTLVITES